MPRRKQKPPQQTSDTTPQHPVTAEDVQLKLPIKTVLLIACRATCHNMSFDDVCEIALRECLEPNVEQSIAHIMRTTPAPTFPQTHIPTNNYTYLYAHPEHYSGAMDGVIVSNAEG